MKQTYTAATVEQAAKMLHVLTQTEDRHTRSHIICMNVAGSANKQLGQAIVKRLTGQDMPVSKCGINYIETLVDAEIKNLLS